MALILMEMTSSPQQLPFLMLVLVLAKQVGDQFNYGVFEHQMMLKGLKVRMWGKGPSPALVSSSL